MMDNNFANAIMPYDNLFTSQQDYIALEEDYNQSYQDANAGEPLQGISRPHTQGRSAEQNQRPPTTQSLGVRGASNAPLEAASRNNTPVPQGTVKPKNIQLPQGTSTRNTPALQQKSTNRNEEHSQNATVPQIQVSQHFNTMSHPPRTISAPAEPNLNTALSRIQPSQDHSTGTSVRNTPAPEDAVKAANDRAASLRAKILAEQAKKANSITPEPSPTQKMQEEAKAPPSSRVNRPANSAGEKSGASSCYDPPSNADIDALFSDARAAMNPPVSIYGTPKTSPKVETSKMLPTQKRPEASLAKEAMPPPNTVSRSLAIETLT